MGEIFISYARADRDRAQTLAQALETQGFTVWWDRKIPPGKTFDQVIQEALDGSACVIVLWSKTSVHSDWVKEEAQSGASRGVLVPVLIDDVPIPLGFGRIQTANLVGWRGNPDHADFKDLSRSVAQTVGVGFNTGAMSVLRKGDAADQTLELQRTPPPTRSPKPPRPTRTRRWLVPASLTLVVAVLAAGGAGYFLLSWPEPSLWADPTDGTSDLPEADDSAASEAEPGDAVPASGPPAESGTPPGTPDRAADAEEPQGTAEDAQVRMREADAEAEAARRREEAVLELAELQVREASSEKSDAELLQAYQQLWADHFADLDSERAREVLEKITDLERSSQAFLDLERRAEDPYLTVRERLALWRAYQPSRPGSQEARRAAEEIEKLAAVTEQRATIAEDDDLVTARGLRRDGEGKPVGPSGVTDEFRAGNVYMFAWVHSPGSETLTLEWLDASGRVLHSRTTRVGRNLAHGYRITYYRHFPDPGDYEVRLYNQEGHLIGRRPFRVLG